MKDTDTVTLDTLLESIISGTDAKMTEIGWERLGENIDEAKAAIIKLFEQAVESAKPQCQGLDEAVRMFAGYVRGENGFDELDFKEWLIEWKKQEIAEARIEEWKTFGEYLFDSDRREISRKFLELYRIRGDNLLRAKSSFTSPNRNEENTGYVENELNDGANGLR